MAVFNPPTLSDMAAVLPTTRGVQRRLFRYYGDNPRGLCVVLVSGHYVTIDNPSSDQLDAAGGIDGIGFFLGGHVYTVSAALAALLAADGYTTTPSPDPPSRNLPWGALEGGTWHDFADNYGTWG